MAAGLYQDPNLIWQSSLLGAGLGFAIPATYSGIQSARQGINPWTGKVKSTFEISSKPNQMHHFVTDKNKNFTPQMKKITDKYGLDLNGEWNKSMLPHQGRHTNTYHDWILKRLVSIDQSAAGDVNIFLELFDQQIKQPVINNPEILYKR